MQYIAYLRTSTKDQVLGIEAQRQKVANYAMQNHGRIIGEYSEHESGKNDNRPELAKAIEHCEQTGAVLLIAKLDRLSRKVSFLFDLKEKLDAKGLKAVAIDFPEVMQSTIMLGMLGSLAQQERELISERTKAALAVKKAQGVKLGRPKGADTTKAVAASVAARIEAADQWAKKAYPLIRSMHAHEMSLNAIAAALNEQGIKTRRGGNWTAKAVSRVLDRCAGGEPHE